MKKRLNKSELGSVMIEALAMLALIALVTPMLYKKSAERTTELQDINAAGEIRAIIKAVDDYVSANYDDISQGNTVTNSCTNHTSHNYSAFKNATEAATTVNLGHFCEFLPYGVLDSNGNARQSRMFKDYQIVLKVKGSAGTAEQPGDRVVTAFVITEPQNDELPMMRSTSIASMIGGNGGFVSETSGEGDSATGEISGNLGIWGISDTKAELGVAVTKGAVVAASLEGISSQNAKIDIDGVLYRVPKSENNYLLNTMSTTLYMGAATGDTAGNDIVNIGKLIIGAREGEDSNDSLYLKNGNIRLAGTEDGDGSIIVDGNGDITAVNGDVIAYNGNLVTGAGAVPSNIFEGNSGNLYVGNEISAGNDVFHVAATGAAEALSFIAGHDNQANTNAVEINIEEKTKINQPLEVTATGDCTVTDGTDAALGEIADVNDNPCALKVIGNAAIAGDLTIGRTFSAKDLHARNKLTVGGSDPDDSKALSVTYATTTGENPSSTATLNFGEDLLRVNKNSNTDYNFSFGNMLSMTKGETENAEVSAIEAYAGRITALTGSTGAILDLSGSDYIRMGLLDNENSWGESLHIYRDNGIGYMELTADDNGGYISLNEEAFKVGKTETGNIVTSSIESFKIRPENATDDTKGFFEVRNKVTGETQNVAEINKLDTYMKNGSQYIQDGAFHLQKGVTENENTSYSDIVRIGQTASSATQIDISGDAVSMAKKDGKISTDADKVLQIDLTSTTTPNGNKYPVYIRKGAIELTALEGDNASAAANTYHNYVQADRFVANYQETGTLPKADGATYSPSYEVNPAYTSVMHDIKLTTRGGARLSDILPDFINKGIYVVDNTYPAKGKKCKKGNSDGEAGASLSGYEGTALMAGKGQKNVADYGVCDSIYQEVSPWAGFVPSPTCPPGYSKVITLTPASFAMAQAGIPYSKENNYWTQHPDLAVPYVVKSPYDYLDGTATDAAPTPLYYQKNTWLKSFVDKYCDGDCSSAANFRGWDVGMGFIYPYNLYKDYIDKAGGSNSFDKSGTGDSTVIWNMFPVYAGTLEGYATVYCYFNRKGGGFSNNLVDTLYDQIDAYRTPSDKTNAHENYRKRLNDKRITNPTNNDLW